MIVREYSLSKSYQPTSCRLLNVSYAQDAQCDYCAAGAKDKEKSGCKSTTFPCATIYVTYKDGDRYHRALLHPDSLQATGAHKQCSYNVCRKTYEENKEAVDEYANQWKSHGDNFFSCFFDTTNPGSVIASKKHSKFDVINCMVWPSALILVCGIIFFHMESKRRGKPFCGEMLDEKKREDKREGNRHDTRLTLLNPYASNDDYSRVKCKILDETLRKDISNSVPSLIKSKVPKGGPKIIIEDENSYITHSVSAEDGLNIYRPQPPETADWNKRKEQFAEYRSKSAESASSQGSRVTGRETPV